MHSPKVEWFLSPLDVLPNTTITPGKIIVNPFSPEGPPYLSTALPIPSSSLHESNYAWTWEKEHSRGGMLGLFAAFASNILGIGGDLSGNLSKGNTLKIEVERLQTLKFEPEDSYLAETLSLERNRKVLDQMKDVLGAKKPVYIVTGVKVAYGARVTRSKEREWGGEGSLGVSPTVPGVELGPKGSVTIKDKDRETIKGPVDFVFAFRLNKVRFLRRRKEEFVQEAFVKGATYEQVISIDDGVGDVIEVGEDLGRRDDLGNEEQDNDEQEEDEVEIVGLEQLDNVADSDFNVDGKTVVDEEDGQACIAIPTGSLSR
ncbi:hypothetical protein UCRPC4_g03985 [Phaeomoniella chlamydospora]|uniref:Uncharacterized protein n=1 Tax=Phaeomoniella chlamydospora TaxID=158046 RepID=A0A0G2EEP7_PHACM|nr:hypothetical protein UCRPC4_g03985 [Phaeomoniella chlamydospora]